VTTLLPFETCQKNLFLNIHCAGMVDAACKIYKKEGFRGLYHGFWVSSIQVMSGVFYISTYEGVRHLLGPTHSPLFLAIAGGGCASVVGQTIIVPFDVISQHLMVLGVTEPVPEKAAHVVSIPGMTLNKHLNLPLVMLYMYMYVFFFLFLFC